MKPTKIIIIFIVIIVAMLGGYWVYNYNQKVSLAQHYYNIGDYKKAYDLDMGRVSDKALVLNNSKNWRMDLERDVEALYVVIMIIYDEIEANEKTDSVYANKLGVYYQEIADHLNISKNHLDEIREMKSDKGIPELTKILNEK